MRIGVLCNHDQIHQIAHSLPIALALADLGHDVLIAASSDAIIAEITRLAGPERLARLRLVRLDVRRGSSRLAEQLLGGIVPARKIVIYRDNLDLFRSLDVLVVTERTSLLLKQRYGLHALKMVLADHGAGDRAIGFGASAARFDHILAAGPKIRDRLVAEAGVDPANITITGYAKFDTMAGDRPVLPMQANGRPTILYNPHLSPHLSSWYRMGRAVLDHFVASRRYNLIFAPHIMLFHRRFVVTIDRLRIDRPGRIDPRWLAAPNIHVDTASRALTDMTYTRAADIYLGDVSSQVYEFMREPRPCLFLNAHHVDHAGDPNYAHWQAGPVLDDVGDLDARIDQAIANHDARYRAVQQRLFAYTFDLTDEPSGMRAARAITALYA
ncbi:hypothetical protein GVO57_00865 [Sphingomonas changnyeongensis]|uniref:Glycosyl transferase n=1 Tax=Sphingomonas changnyeongensis TaxID=2698679 RepID=A0A7Z2NTY8_9SPHN|nr:hypothetical protein [Sphingomonas changnyeongensis]QHL89632.1 hypothetical protein GVO57_00865 [Sphingomonas changnyeongensis]